MEQIKKTPLFIIAAILIGLKSYIVYRFYFNLSIETAFQEIILIINAFAFSFLIFSFAVWLNEKRQKKFILIMSIVLTFIMLVNLWYYRNFSDFLTLPTLMQFNNAGDLGTSILSLVHVLDILLIVDVILIYYFIRKQIFPITGYSKMFKRRIVAVALSAVMLNIALAEMERPMLFKRGFDREYLVKNVGIYTFHAYDAFITVSTQSKRIFADGSEFKEIKEYVNNEVQDEEVMTNKPLEGIAEGKNVVYISVESLQNFVIDRKVHGKEITPFLNDLIKDSYYFNNYYHQTALGKTSDHEFLLANSLYPLPNSAAFFTHAQNEYHALPEIIKNEKGYNSYVFHANNASFWNRNIMYETLGYDQFFDIESFDFDKSDVIGWGLNDKMFFDQSVDILKKQKEPFYAKFLTLTNHFPFDIPEEEATLEPYNSDSETVNQYFQTVRYSDEALEKFFKKMKDEGMYKDTIFIIGGDHYGIPSYHNEALAQYLGKEEITPYDDALLQKVPLIIHIPGHDVDRTISKLGGQIDFKPTVLSLLGVDYSNDIMFGNSLFAPEKERKDFIAFRDGRVIGEEYVYAAGVCYNDQGKMVEETECQPMREKAMKELNFSDEIIYGDLLRFYDFEKGKVEVEEN